MKYVLYLLLKRDSMPKVSFQSPNIFLSLTTYINSLLWVFRFLPNEKCAGLFTFPMAGLGVTHGSDRIWYLLVGFLVLCPNLWDRNCHLETSSYMSFQDSVCTTKD